MADLMATQAGRDMLTRASCFLARQFASRRMQTGFWNAFKAWETTGYFDISLMMGPMNPIYQDDIESLNAFLASQGCLDVIETNMTIYVDSVNGSDVTGDGSADYPYASMAFIERLRGSKIDAHVRIILLEDLDMVGNPLDLDFTIGPNGCLSIGGRGAPTLVDGPYTVTGVTAYGAPPLDYGYNILAGAAAWGVYDLVGKWLRFDTGANAGEAYPINTNDATHVFIRGGLEAVVSNGDTFSIVEPSITLSCQTINIQMKGPSQIYPVTFNASRFNLMNLAINLDGPPTVTYSKNFLLKNDMESQISFVTLISESKAEPIYLESSLNRYRSVDSDISTYLNSTIHNIDGAVSQGSPAGLLCYNPDPGSIYTYNALIIKGAEFIRCVECFGVTEVNKADVDIQLCGFGKLRGDGGSNAFVNRCLFSGFDDAIQLLYCGEWTVKRSVLTDNAGGINLLWITVGRVHLFPDTIAISSGFGITGRTVYYNRGAAAVFVNTDPAALIGGGGAIWFPGGVGVTAFPAADAMATDNLGNTFSYISTP
jgi:hypothetical protein